MRSDRANGPLCWIFSSCSRIAAVLGLSFLGCVFILSAVSRIVRVDDCNSRLPCGCIKQIGSGHCPIRHDSTGRGRIEGDKGDQEKPHQNYLSNPSFDGGTRKLGDPRPSNYPDTVKDRPEIQHLLYFSTAVAAIKIKGPLHDRCESTYA